MLLPFQGVSFHRTLPRALPWADILLAFQAVAPPYSVYNIVGYYLLALNLFDVVITSPFYR